MRRRRFIAAAAGLGTVALAGCFGNTGGGDGGTSGDGDGSGGTGSFRLLISDQPATIEDFESLDVTLSSARVFRADEEETLTPAMVNETADAEETTTVTEATGRRRRKQRRQKRKTTASPRGSSSSTSAV
ncbi:hypothetical protein [Halosegnis sp.]|uniref:hypothetical protein n=1 Tax=Halosegnis sp. TaxID=2864959 RepID=UPI0035D47E0E